MAVIPRVNPTGGPSPTPAGPRISGFPSPVGAAMDLGTAVAGLFKNMREQSRANEIARRKIDAQKQLDDLEFSIKNGMYTFEPDGKPALAEKPGGDYSRGVEAYENLSARLKADILTGIEDETVSAAVANSFDAISGQKLALVRNATIKKMRDQTVAELDVTTEMIAQAYVNASTEGEREELVGTYRDHLVAAVHTGAITREDMGKRAQKFRNTLVELEVNRDLTNALNDTDGSEEVMRRLRDKNEYQGLTPERRQQFTEEAQRQFNAAVNFEFQMEERQERRERRRLEKLQEQTTRELAGGARPIDPDTNEVELPTISQGTIEKQFQLGLIDRAQRTYLLSMLENPSPNPDPLTRFANRERFTAQAYEGTLNVNEVLMARARGEMKDEDITSILSIHDSRQAAGGLTATTDSKRALDFVGSYLFGVKELINVTLEDDQVRELGAIELLFHGRVERGENPFEVAADLIQQDAQDAIRADELPAQVQGLWLEHSRDGTQDEFWPEAVTTIEEDRSLSTSQRRSLVMSLELIRQQSGKKLQRLPQILQELEIRAERSK